VPRKDLLIPDPVAAVCRPMSVLEAYIIIQRARAYIYMDGSSPRMQADLRVDLGTYR
jgi:hypothetical protein